MKWQTFNREEILSEAISWLYGAYLAPGHLKPSRRLFRSVHIRLALGYWAQQLNSFHMQGILIEFYLKLNSICKFYHLFAATYLRHSFNTLKPRNTSISLWTWSSFLMVFPPFDINPNLNQCWWFIVISFCRNCVWKCRRRNVGPFFFRFQCVSQQSRAAF